MAGKIQNADIKTLGELTALGATKTQLLNTDKMYSAKSDDVLETVLRKNNFAAVVDPDVTDDSTVGYEVGSRWINTATGSAYTLVDASVGAAVWKKGGAGGEGKLNFITIGTMEEASATDFDKGNDPVWSTINLPFAGTLSISSTNPFRGEFSLLYENAVVAGDSTDDWIKRSTIVPAGYRRDCLLDFYFQYSSKYADGNIRVKLIEQPSGRVLVDEPLNQHISGALGDAAEFRQRIALSGTTTSLDWGFHVINGEASADMKVDDVTITPELGFIEQNVINVNPDSMIRLDTGNGHGTTNTKIRRFANVRSNIGVDIEYNDSAADGASFLIKKSGIYHISYSDYDASTQVSSIGISKNSTELTTAITAITAANRLAAQGINRDAAGDEFASVSWSGYLEVGDIIRPHISTGLMEAGADQCHFTISRQGDTAQFAPTYNQKVKIPVSVLRLKGLSGTSFTGSKIKWDNIQEQSGSGFVLDQTDGSVLTIKKDGVLHIDAGAISATANNLSIQKNDVVMTIIANVAGNHTNSSASLNVKINDVIKFVMASPQANADASLLVIHQEQEVSVNINTVDPQYEDLDSMVQLASPNGYGTTNTVIRRFATLQANMGSAITYTDDAAAGASFTINEDGYYDISYSDAFNAASSMGISKNSNQLTTALYAISASHRLAADETGGVNFSANCAWSGYLQAGDVIRAHAAAVANGANDRTHFTIAKKANPSVIGIDGRQLAAYVRDPDSMIRVNTSNGYGSINTKIRQLTNVVENFGSAILFANSAVDGCSFTIQEDGIYHFTYVDSNTSQNMGISKNSTELTTGVALITAADRLVSTGTVTTNAVGSVSWSGYLKAGDVIRPHSDGAGGGTAAQCSMTAAKLGELREIVPLTNQTVEIPSSELRYEGSTGRGTGAEAVTVKFNTLKFLNDTNEVFSVNNTNGTVVTIQKSGFLSVVASLYIGDLDAQLVISKNSIDPSLMPIADERIASHQGETTNAVVSVSATFKVKAGDIIRLAANTAVINSDAANSIQMTFQEQDVEVAINNIEPQYEDLDSMIRLHTANGVGSSAIKIRRFANVVRQLGSDITYNDSATEGASFTINKSGIYHIEYTDNLTVADSVGISINSNQLNSNIYDIDASTRLVEHNSHAASNSCSVSWSGYLQAGDVIRPHLASTNSGVAARCNFTIAKQGNPSVVGIDGRELTAFQELPDSAVNVYNGNGYGSTGLYARRFSGLEKLIGNDINYVSSSVNGDYFEIKESGIYNISYSEHFSASSHFGITKNAAANLNLSNYIVNDPKLVLAMGQIASVNLADSCSWNGYLEAGDIIRAHSNGQAMGPDAGKVHFAISKAGKLKNLIPTTDQTVEIPTHELIMQDLLGKGSGSEAWTAQYSYMRSISGDGFEVSNSNGTIITIKKDGLLHLTTHLIPLGGTIWISKNASNPAAIPGDLEYLVAQTGSPSGEQQDLSWTGFVKVGDKIRVGANVTISASVGKSLVCVLQEQNVEVAITNIDPQFEDNDSMVRLNGTNGNGSTGTYVRRWSNLVTNYGSAIEYVDDIINGGYFKIKEDGVYNISYSDRGVASGTWIGITVNAPSVTTSIVLLDQLYTLAYEYQLTDSAPANCAWSGVLKAGDIIRAQHNGTIYATDQTKNKFTIAKVGKPSVIGIDGRPVDAFRQDPDSAIFLTGGAGVGSTGTKIHRFTNIDQFEGDSIEYVPSTVDGDSFVIKKKGIYHINFIGVVSAAGIDYFGISRNASSLTTPVYNLAATENLGHVGIDGTSGDLDSAHWTGILEVGDIIRAHIGGTNVNTTNTSIRFSMSKLGDIHRIATTSENTVDIPTSELLMRQASTISSNKVKFDEIESIKGDGLVVDNSAWTKITVKKDGLLHISANLQISSNVSIVMQINGISVATETQQTGWYSSLSASQLVKAGDIVELSSTIAPSANTNNTFRFHLVETKVAVAISNIDPQFEDTDSMIRLHTGNGGGSTNTAIRRFSTLIEQLGSAIIYEDSATLGGKFTVQENGIYHITYVDHASVSGNFAGISVNSAQLTTDIHSISAANVLGYSAINPDNTVKDAHLVSWSGYLRKNDVIRAHISGAIGNFTNDNTVRFTIAKQGNPSIAGVDVTQFAQVQMANITEWQNYTPSNSQGLGTLTNVNIKWRRVGANMEIEGEATTGTVDANEAQLGLPAGYIIATIANSSGSISGVVGNSNSNTAAYYTLATAGDTFINFTSQGTGQASTDPLAGNAFLNSSTRFIFRASIPIEGWKAIGGTSDFTVIESPSDINSMVRVHTSNGYGSTNTAIRRFTTIAEEFGSDITYTQDAALGDSFTINEDGQYHISFTSDSNGVHTAGISKNSTQLTTAVASINVADRLVSESIGGNGYTGCMSWSGILKKGDVIRAHCSAAQGANTVARENFTIARIGTSQIYGFHHRQIAIVKDQKSSGVAGGDFISGAWRVRNLNVLEGDTSFISLGTDDFTLIPGKYLIHAIVPAHHVTNGTLAKLYDFTNSVDKAFSSSEHCGAIDDAVNNHLYAVINLTEDTTFEIQQKCTTTRLTDGFGAPSSQGTETYTQVIVEKLG